jgi:indole-3-acetate monooxygenase
MFLPRAEANVIDTWHTGGLRGTGSHDFEVKDVFVPENRSVWFTDPPIERGPLYSLPAVTLFAPLIASVSLGIARHALEAFKELAGVKTPTYSQDLLRTNPVAQSQLGQAEGLLRAGRACLFESLADSWGTASRGVPSRPPRPSASPSPLHCCACGSGDRVNRLEWQRSLR